MKKKSGFTLIELLVVISIIALLLAILMPSLSKVKTMARETVCSAHLHQWAVLLMTFATDNDGKFFEGSTTVEKTSSHWNMVLQPYINNQYDAAVCPMAKRIRSDIDGWLVGGTFISWGKLSSWGGVGEYGSYGINQWVTDEKAESGKNPTGRGKDSWYYRRPESISQPENVPMFMDAIWTGSWPRDTDGPPMEPVIMPVYSIGETMTRFCIDRHKGGVQVAFADTSVEDVTAKQLWGLKWHRDFDTDNFWTTDRANWPDWMDDIKGFE